MKKHRLAAVALLSLGLVVVVFGILYENDDSRINHPGRTPLDSAETTAPIVEDGPPAGDPGRIELPVAETAGEPETGEPAPGSSFRLEGSVTVRGVEGIEHTGEDGEIHFLITGRAA